MLICILLLPWARLNRGKYINAPGRAALSPRLPRGVARKTSRRRAQPARSTNTHAGTCGHGAYQRTLPEGSAPTLTPITQKLPVRVEFLTHGAAPALSDPEAPYLLLLGEHAHHHSSLSGWLSHLDTAPSLVALSTAHPQQKGILHRANPEFDETEDRTETVSSGAFCCHPSAVPPASLGEGEQPWRLLAERNGEDVHFDVSERVLWRRVDQPGGVRQVKNMLFSQVTKTTSGFVSRHINARLSIPTSKLLVETGLSPHAITVLLVLTTGL